MNTPRTLSEYLFNRGLVLDPVKIQEKDDEILNDDKLLEEAGQMFQAHGGIFQKAIQARINAIAYELLVEAVPEEVPVLRQALVEVTAILDDFRRYEAEAKRREAQRQRASEEAGEAPTDDTPLPEEGQVQTDL